jgi:hypothetical protein
MGKCITCGEEAKDNHQYCLKCYLEQKNGKPVAHVVESSSQPVLSDQDLGYREDVIKGRIAETLIEELFLSLGWNVFRYGMENTIPGVMKLLKGIKSEAAEDIRRMPDFVVQDKTGTVYFIEVKFRANETFEYKDLRENYPYDNAYIVLVSTKHIKCLSVQDLKNGKVITPQTQNYLGRVKEFDLDKVAIISFCDFAVKFFGQV